MEIKRHAIYDTRLGLYVTAYSLQSANTGAAEMNRVAGYCRYVAFWGPLHGVGERVLRGPLGHRTGDAGTRGALVLE